MQIPTVGFAILALLATSLASYAETIYNISLDTSSLLPGPAGIAFQFGDGSFIGDANNIALIGDFQFGAGSTLPTQFTWGASGSLDGTVSLADSDPAGTYFGQLFTPGATLNFLLSLTTNVDPDGVFDTLTFSLTDGSFFPIPTTSAAFGDYPDILMSITLDSDHPTIRTYGSDPERTLIALNAPTAETAVPEPAMWLPVGLVLCAASCRRHWRARRG